MSKIWSYDKQDYIERPIEVIEFINEIEEVCKRHNFSISHEDGHGAFELTEFNDHYIKWLKSANLCKKYK